MKDRGFVDSQKGEAFEIIDPHRLRVTFEQQPVSLFGFAQGLLNPLSISDVTGHSQNVYCTGPRQCERHLYSLERTRLACLRISKLLLGNELRTQRLKYLLVVLDEGLCLLMIAIEIAFCLANNLCG